MLLRRECQKAAATAPAASVETLNFRQSLEQDKRGDSLAAYFQRYQPTLHIERQPSEETLSLLFRRISRKSAEFPQLSHMGNSFGSRDSYIEQLKLAHHLPINLDVVFTRGFRILITPRGFWPRGARAPLGLCFGIGCGCWAPVAIAGRCDKHISTTDRLSRIPAKAGHIFHHKIIAAEMDA